MNRAQGRTITTSTIKEIEWRRNKVQELLAKGNNNHYEIASILQVSKPTISRDIEYLDSKLELILEDTLTKRCQKSVRNVLMD